MSSPRRPRPLVEEPALQRFLERARQLPSADRLDKNWAAIQGKLDPATSRPEALGAGWRWRPVLVGAVLLLTALGAGATGLWLAGRESPVQVQPEAERAEPHPVVIPPRPTPVPPQVDQVPPAPAVPPSSPRPAGGRVPTKVAELDLPEPAMSPPAPAAPVEGELGEQLRLFREAREAIGRGAFEQALKALAELQGAFPEGPLRAEAGVLRAEALVGQGRLDAAIAQLDALLEDPALVGRRASLLKMQGDLAVRQQRCDQARRLFQRALGLGLTGQDAEGARQGLKACAEKQ